MDGTQTIHDVMSASLDDLRHAQPDPARTYTVEEYFRWDAVHEGRLEYIAGRIDAMAGGSEPHALVCTNIAALLHRALEDGPCRVYGSDLHLGVRAMDAYRHPDVTVVCDEPDEGPEQPRPDICTNPTVIVEVLSPSTEGDDRGIKLREYTSLPSLREYMLVDHRDLHVDIFSRREDGTWVYQPTDGIDAVAHLPSLDLKLEHRRIFAKLPA